MDENQQLAPRHRRSLEAWDAAPVAPEYTTSEPAPDLRDYLAVLRRYWVTIVSVGVVVVTIVTIASLKTRPVYEAAALVEIDKENTYFYPYQQTSAPEYYWDTEIYMRTKADVLQSEALAEQTIKMLELHRHPEFVNPESSPAVMASADDSGGGISILVGIFQSRLSVSPRRNSRLVEVRFAAHDPRLASQVVNTLVDNFIDHNFRVRYESVSKASDWLTHQLHELQAKVEQSQDAVVAYEKKNNIWAIDERQTVTTQKLADLNRELTMAQANRYQKESAYKLTGAGNLDALPEVSTSPLIQALRGRQAVLNDEYTQARLQFGPKYPKVLRLEAQLQELSGLIEAEKNRIAKRIETEYQKAVEQERLLRVAVEGDKKATHELNEKLVQYNLLKQEAGTNRQLYEGLLQRIKEAGIGAGLRSSNIRVVDAARVPQVPVRPRTTFNILLGTIVGLLGGLGLAFLRAYLDDTVKTHKEVERVTGLPTLAFVPQLAGSNGREKRQPAKWLSRGTNGKNGKTSIELITQEKPLAAVSEAFRALRTSILVSTPDHPPKVILVTSCLPGEGKTTTAINLALSFAQRGDRTLLVDADLRNPESVHTAMKLGPTQTHGLSNYLAGVVELEDIIASQRDVGNLSTIARGIRTPNPAELLSSNRINTLLETARSRFHFIIIDSPPVLAVTDPVLLSTVVDGVLLVTRSGVSSRQALERTHDVLRGARARVLGVVLNGIDSYSHYYDYYKYYPYKPSPDETRSEA